MTKKLFDGILFAVKNPLSEIRLMKTNELFFLAFRKYLVDRRIKHNPTPADPGEIIVRVGNYDYIFWDVLDRCSLMHNYTSNLYSYPDISNPEFDFDKFFDQVIKGEGEFTPGE